MSLRGAKSCILICMKLLRLTLALLLAAAVTVPAAAQSAVYPQQEGFVDAHGVLIYYVTFGNGPPLVVLHGGPGASHDYFLPWLLPLARTHRLIFIDERGSGRSQRLQDTSLYTVEGDVEDIEAVRVALHLGKISLLGHSCGGVLAQAYALKYQQNLSHLILNSTFASTREMNVVLAREKAAMPADKLKRLNELNSGLVCAAHACINHLLHVHQRLAVRWFEAYIQIRALLAGNGGNGIFPRRLGMTLLSARMHHRRLHHHSH